jgi:hypothetical protein
LSGAPRDDNALPWSMSVLATLTSVSAVGYPHALDSKKDYGVIIQRAFAGHVVAVAPFHLPQHDPEQRFLAYELSIPVPKGLSGAPLVRADGAVVGVVHHMRTTEFNTVYEALAEQEGQVNFYQVRSQVHNCGIAVTSRALGFHSNLLGMSLREYLQKEELLRD